MFKIKVVSDYQNFFRMYRDWNYLVACSNKNEVFFTHEWFDCWWRAFGKKHDLFILTVEELTKPMKLQAIAPFIISKIRFRGFPIRIIQFMANDDSPRCDFIVRKDIADIEKLFEALVSFLYSSNHFWDLLFLGNIEKKSSTLQAFHKIIQSRRGRYTSQSKLACPWIPVNPDWNFYYSSISRRSKMTINNIRNRLQKTGDIVIQEYNSTERLSDISIISMNAWKYKEGKSFLNKEDRKLFFSLLSNAAEKKGWLSLWVLYVKDKPAAYEYHLRYNGKEAALLAEFDQYFLKTSPGTYLDFYIMKSVHEQGLSEYDLGGSLDQYKKKWKPRLRETEDYYVYNCTPIYLVERWIIPTVRRIRNKIYSLISKTMRRRNR